MSLVLPVSPFFVSQLSFSFFFFFQFFISCFEGFRDEIKERKMEGVNVEERREEQWDRKKRVEKEEERRTLFWLLGAE